MTRCAVLGSPVAHSLSPVMHRAAYRALGLVDWTYEAIEVAEADFAAFVDGLDSSWRGLSVTAPLKHAAARAATLRDPAVERTGVANTLVFDGSEHRAANTDIPGGAAALREQGVTRLGSVTILGAGATARSVGETAVELGAERISFRARRPEAARDLAARFDDRAETKVLALGDASEPVDLVISTIPTAAATEPVLALVERAAALFDVIYDPWPTPLAAAAQRRGIPVVSGLDLLAHQAVLQVELMTGGSVEASTLRDAATAELARRA